MTGLWIVGGIAIAVVATIALSFAVMYLWNWLAPKVFNLPKIQFKHALGIFLLSRLLFGGFGGHGGPHGAWKHHGQENCNNRSAKHWNMGSEQKNK